MATGDVTLFQEFIRDMGDGDHDFDNDTFKIGLIDNVVTPTAADATPAWGATSGVDYDGNEVDSTAGNYTAGGEPLASVTWVEAAGVGTFDAADVSFAQHGSGFTNAYWGIIFNETATNNEAIGFVELGGPVSEVAGPVAINWNASGIFTVTAS
jgi:hypothetical protein